MVHEVVLGLTGESTAAGHAAVHLSNVCTDDYTSLRRCRPDEKDGVVLASYPDFGLNKPYEWMAIPLMPYLYGVANPEDIPVYSNGEVRNLARDWFRTTTHINDRLRPPVPGAKKGPERWRQMVGVGFNRDIYSIVLTTTQAEDDAFIEKWNNRPNVNKFNTMYNNCTDFAVAVLNGYFPHSVKRDYINDFTMTTPKAIARSYTRFARQHPDRNPRIIKYPQLAGPIRRSNDNRKFAEHAIRSRKFLAPIILFKPVLLGIFATTYFTTGRYDMHAQYERQMRTKEELSRMQAANLHGTSEEWASYKAAFQPVKKRAIEAGHFRDETEIQSFYRDLEVQSEPEIGPRGIQLKVKAYGQEKILGLTSAGLTAPDSDRALAYKLLIAKIDATLRGPSKNRPLLADFERDWRMLAALNRVPGPELPAGALPPVFREAPIKLSAKKSMQMLWVHITH